jgi:hypothetical protein
MNPILPKAFDDLPVVTKNMLAADPQFHPRRFTDPVSQLNDEIHDTTRRLANAVEMIDGLGIRIIAVEADRARNRRIQVAYSRECNALEAVEVTRDAIWSHWCANRFGVEIRWCIPVEAA